MDCGNSEYRTGFAGELDFTYRRPSSSEDLLGNFFQESKNQMTSQESVLVLEKNVKDPQRRKLIC